VIETNEEHRKQAGELMAVVLLVADNDPGRERLSRRLQRRGCAIEVASDGVEAVRIAGLLRPEIIVIDLSLTTNYAREAALQIKAAPKTNSIPIIALTENDLAPTPSGFDASEPKPVNLKRLIMRMELLLTREITVEAGTTPVKKRKLTGQA
jgi:CheY-like chemotaxis protein